MNHYVETEVSEAEAIIAGISAEPPTVTLVYSGRDVDGLRRDFVQQVSARDADVGRRILSELNKGDRAAVTVINEWREDGCDTYLADFKKVSAVDQETSGRNGMPNLVHMDIREVTPAPVQGTREKARK